MDKEIITLLKNGGIGVLPTDTMYGIVGSAFDKKAVERIYKVRKRTPSKPLIILIGSLKDLQKFCITKVPLKVLKSLWPEKISIILPCPQKKFEYLHRGTKKLAFRFPNDKDLIALIKKTGPLVAPSANTEGEPASKTIKEAQDYFGSEVDLYVDKGKLTSKPSTIVEISIAGSDVGLILVREGAVKII